MGQLGGGREERHPLVDNQGRLLAIRFLISAAQARGLNMATGCGEIMSNFTGRIEKRF